LVFAGEPVVEMVAHGGLDHAGGLGRGEAVLGLAHEFRLRDEAGDQRAAAARQVVAGDVGGLLVGHKLPIGADALQDRGPEPGLMRAALGRGHGVAVGLDEAVARGRPGDGPFDGTGDVELGLEVDLSGEGRVGIGGRGADGLGQVIAEAAGEVERGLGRRLTVVDAGFPADLDAGEKVCLRPDHLEKTGRFEPVGAEDLLVGVEGDGGAAPVGDGPFGADGALGDAARELLHEKLAVAGDLNAQVVGERVDDGDTDAVQTAGGLVGLARELAARVQRAEDDLKRALVGELRMRVDGDATAVVADGDGVIGMQLHLDAGGMAGHRLVHGVVEHLGHQVVQRALIGAADIHAGALADGLQPLQHLDGGGVVALRGVVSGKEIVGHGAALSCGGFAQ
jgi:hypothetical protein